MRSGVGTFKADYRLGYDPKPTLKIENQFPFRFKRVCVYKNCDHFRDASLSIKHKSELKALRQNIVMEDNNIICEGRGDGSEVISPTTISATSSEVEHVVEVVAEGKVSGAKSKKNLFKKIFMPWKWKAKRKTDKFKQRCTILERKISVKHMKQDLLFTL